MKLTVEGNDYELSPELEKEYGEAFKAACEAMTKTLEIVHSPGYSDRSSWKADCSSGHVSVHYKDIDGLRYFAAKAKLAVSASVVFQEHWNNIENVKDFNDNMRFSRVLKKLTTNIDVANYASNEKFMVKSREFVVGRMQMQLGNAFVLAARSCDLSGFQGCKDTVRGFVHLGAGYYYPDPEDPMNSSIYEYIVSMDLKGMMLKTVANQALGKFVLSDVESNRAHAAKLAERHS